MACKFTFRVSVAFTGFLFLSVSFSPPVCAQDCTPDDIMLSSQAEVDNFQVNHGPCDQATNLIIEGADIVNLDSLAGLITVSGELRIERNPQLTNVDGFPSLTHVGGLSISNNASLIAIDGLTTLTSTDSWLLIRFNDELKSVRGLSDLSHVGQNLFVSHTRNLTALDGLSGVTSVTGHLVIMFNSVLDNLDSLSGLTSVGDSVYIWGNSNLHECGGLMRLLDNIDDGDSGPGAGSAAVPDVGGEVDLHDNGVGCNSIRQILLGIDRFKINPGLNDVWFDPETSGQGFLITVLPDAETIFLAWFTFDTVRPPEGTEAHLGDAGHRWLTAQGGYSRNEASLAVFLTKGGVFDSDEPTPEIGSMPIGLITIFWDDCENARLYYSLTGLGEQGWIDIRRVVDDNVALCEALSSDD
jgi:hypothetical protein